LSEQTLAKVSLGRSRRLTEPATEPGPGPLAEWYFFLPMDQRNQPGSGHNPGVLNPLGWRGMAWRYVQFAMCGQYPQA